MSGQSPPPPASLLKLLRETRALLAGDQPVNPYLVASMRARFAQLERSFRPAGDRAPADPEQAAEAMSGLARDMLQLRSGQPSFGVLLLQHVARVRSAASQARRERQLPEPAYRRFVELLAKAVASYARSADAVRARLEVLSIEEALKKSQRLHQKQNGVSRLAYQRF